MTPIPFVPVHLTDMTIQSLVLGLYWYYGKEPVMLDLATEV